MFDTSSNRLALHSAIPAINETKHSSLNENGMKLKHSQIYFRKFWLDSLNPQFAADLHCFCGYINFVKHLNNSNVFYYYYQ